MLIAKKEPGIEKMDKLMKIVTQAQEENEADLHGLRDDEETITDDIRESRDRLWYLDETPHNLFVFKLFIAIGVLAYWVTSCCTSDTNGEVLPTRKKKVSNAD